MVVVVVTQAVMSNSLPPPWTAVYQASLSFTILWSLLKFMSTELMMPSNHLSPHSSSPLNLSQHQGLFQAFALRQPKYQSFSISPSKERSGLISFSIDWFDLLVIQRIMKSHPQHYSLKASILQCSAFFIVQLSHSHMTTGKNIALTRWTLDII